MPKYVDRRHPDPNALAAGYTRFQYRCPLMNVLDWVTISVDLRLVGWEVYKDRMNAMGYEVRLLA